MREDVLQKLDDLDLRKTPIRKEVLQLFLEQKGRAFSSKEIEMALDNPDRITLYRTLKVFEQNGVIHQAVDGSGTAKYALCDDDCSDQCHHDDHAHFHCLNCGKTVCLEGKIESTIKVPKNFQVEQTHLVLEGRCSDCVSA
ncbi:MAG: transcriptional repressor [Phaeodactylibacter sp.]|nr:transcriptional repressor [Phaeodactylibacter sp.]